MKCTYKVEGNEYESFIKGENYRGKIKTAEGKTGEVIMKNNCMWTWTVEEAQGIKTCFEESDTGDTYLALRHWMPKEYFLEEKGDITRWSRWEDRMPIIQKEYPELIQAMLNVKLAERTLTAVLQDMEESFYEFN